MGTTRCWRPAEAGLRPELVERAVDTDPVTCFGLRSKSLQITDITGVEVESPSTLGPADQPRSGSSPSWVNIPNRSAVPQISAILPSAIRKMPIASQTARRPVGAGR